MKLFASQGEHGVTIPLVVNWSLRPYLHTKDSPRRYCFLVLINQRIGRESEIIDEPARSTGRPASIHTDIERATTPHGYSSRSAGRHTTNFLVREATWEVKGLTVSYPGSLGQWVWHNG